MRQISHINYWQSRLNKDCHQLSHDSIFIDAILSPDAAALL